MNLTGRFLYFFISILFSTVTLYAQEPDWEWIFEGEEESSGASELVELMEEYGSSRLDINSAGYRQMLELPMVTPATARALISHREEQGAFGNIEQVSQLGLPPEQESVVRRFFTVTLSEPPSIELRSRMIRSGVDEGYDNSPVKTYTRAGADWKGGYVVGALVEHDPGEEEFGDFSSGYAAMNHTDGSVKVLLGDYRIEAGQGLILWSGGSFGKGSAPILPLRRSARGVIPFRSSMENEALRGVAFEMRAAGQRFIGFISDRHLDGAPTDSGTASNFRDSGLHRTEGEIAGKGFIRERTVGLRVIGATERGSWGATVSRASYEPSITPEDTPEKMFSFRGDKVQTVGADWRMSFGGMDFFGEAARSNSKGTAVVLGALYGEERGNVGLAYRKYDTDYVGIRGSGFGGESTDGEGLYASAELRLNESIWVWGYYDLFRNQWMTSRALSPPRSRDYRFQITHRLARGHALKFRVSGTSRERSFRTEDMFGRFRKVLDEVVRRNYRLWANHGLTERLSVGWRVERVTTRLPEHDENGFLVSADVTHRVRGVGFLHARFTQFDTDSWDSKLYIYERDLPGVVRNAAVYGEGSRLNFLAGKEITRYFSASLKYELTSRRRSVGTGESDAASKYGVQIDFKI